MEQLQESKTKWGRKKLDAAQLLAQKASKVSGGRPSTKYGRRKGAVEAAGLVAATEPTETKVAPKVKPLASVAKLTEALEKKPLLVEAMLEAELKAEKPRISALKLFRATEAGRKKARPEVLERIDAAIAAMEVVE